MGKQIILIFWFWKTERKENKTIWTEVNKFEKPKYTNKRLLKRQRNFNGFSKSVTGIGEEVNIRVKEDKSNLKHFVNVLTNHKKSEQYFIFEKWKVYLDSINFKFGSWIND